MKSPLKKFRPPVENFWILPCPRGLCLFHSSFPLGCVDAYQWRNKLTMGPGVQKCEWAPKQCFDFVTTILDFFLNFFFNFTLQWGCRRRYFSSIFSPTSLFKGVVVVDILKMSNFIFRRSVVVVAFFLIFVKRPNQGPLFLVGPGAAAPPAPMVVTPLTPTKFCQKLLLTDFLTCHTKGRRLVSKQAYQF